MERLPVFKLFVHLLLCLKLTDITAGSCKSMEPPNNGEMFGRLGAQPVGTRIYFLCYQGFRMIGKNETTCLSTGYWSTKRPYCQASAGYDQCGQAGEVRRGIAARVVRGKNAQPGAWPWQALLMRNSGHRKRQITIPKQGIGGGAVISNRWILTAGHLFGLGGIAEGFVSDDWKNLFLIVLGMTKYAEAKRPIPPEIKVYEPADVLRHPNYDEGTYNFDAALVRVGFALKVKGSIFVRDFDAPSGIQFNQFIRPVCMPCLNSCGESTTQSGENLEINQTECSNYGKSLRAKKSNPKDSIVVVTGFGSTLPKGVITGPYEYPYNLQQADLELLDDATCSKALKSVNEIYASIGSTQIGQYTDHMLCARGYDKTNLSDSCQGDSGGPLVKQVFSANGDSCWIQIGIVSWGLGCGQLDSDGEVLPAFYTDVTSIMSWIVATTQTNEKTTLFDLPAEEKSCHPPNAPKNGNVEVLDKSYATGSVAHFSCNDGYVLSGQDKGICSASGQWVPTPGCEEKLPPCISPRSPRNGKYIAETTGFTVGSRIKYVCNAGYVLHGNDEGICNEDGHWGNVPICEIPIKTCKHPAAPRNGKVYTKGNKFGSIAIFSCDHGYVLNGQEEGLCTEYGYWSPYPTCEPMYCSAPDSPSHGSVFVTSYSFGSIASYFCNNGYSLRGPKEGSCNAYGEWGPSPTCEKAAASVCARPRAPTNGGMKPFEEVYEFGDYIQYTCEYGFELKGNEWAECMPSGRFSNETPKCKKAAETSCGWTPAPIHGRVSPPKTAYNIGEHVTYTCESGYNLKGAQWAECLPTGNFSNKTPKCDKNLKKSCYRACRYKYGATCQCDVHCSSRADCCKDHFLYCR